MERFDLNIYGSNMDRPRGYIAVVGPGDYAHRFGGDSWAMSDTHPIGRGPTQLLTLDLHDPKLAALADSGLDELPLCAFLNCLNMPRQVYTIDPQHRTVVLQPRPQDTPVELLAVEDLLPHPLPEKTLYLRNMRSAEYPVDEGHYWNCCDGFVGGGGVIRVLGPAVWLQSVEEETCRCGRAMPYIASIGYEVVVSNGSTPLLDGAMFFPGEFGTYFFFCPACRAIKVICQST